MSNQYNLPVEFSLSSIQIDAMNCECANKTELEAIVAENTAG